MYTVCEKDGASHKVAKTKKIIKISNKDLQGRAYAANKVLNRYFKSNTNQPIMLPESSLNPNTRRMTRIEYFYYINKVLYNNCQLLNIKYPLYQHHISFALDTKEKVYGPILEYFENLIN